MQEASVGGGHVLRDRSFLVTFVSARRLRGAPTDMYKRRQQHHRFTRPKASGHVRPRTAGSKSLRRPSGRSGRPLRGDARSPRKTACKQASPRSSRPLVLWQPTTSAPVRLPIAADMSYLFDWATRIPSAHRYYTELRKTYGPVFTLRYGSRLVCVITEHQASLPPSLMHPTLTSFKHFRPGRTRHHG